MPISVCVRRAEAQSGDGGGGREIYEKSLHHSDSNADYRDQYCTQVCSVHLQMVLQFLDHCHRKILLNVFCAGIFTSKLYKPLPIGGFINLFRIPALKAVCAVDGVDGRGQCCSMERPRLTSHLNFEYFLCLMSLEYHLAHHWQNI